MFLAYVRLDKNKLHFPSSLSSSTPIHSGQRRLSTRDIQRAVSLHQSALIRDNLFRLPAHLHLSENYQFVCSLLLLSEIFLKSAYQPTNQPIHPVTRPTYKPARQPTNQPTHPQPQSSSDLLCQKRNKRLNEIPIKNLINKVNFKHLGEGERKGVGVREKNGVDVRVVALKFNWKTVVILKYNLF